MSRRLQMLQVARLARQTLGDSADLVAEQLQRAAVATGGYANRDGKPDLYYTPFAIDSLIALSAAEVPAAGGAGGLFDPAAAHAQQTFRWLDETVGDGAALDFVHRACLARVWAVRPAADCPEHRRQTLAATFTTHRAADGGYASRPGRDRGSVYGSFLVVNAHDDLGLSLPAETAAAIVGSVTGLQAADGGWSNEPEQPFGSTPATAAAVVLLHQFGAAVPQSAVDWLLARQHPSGGFLATTDAPLPDLLSTAVSLHALDAVGADWRGQHEQILDFIDSLWSAAGGFHGSWADDNLDSEYTFYGLLALGHASV
jgi:prenyltransferase beta subunit